VNPNIPQRTTAALPSRKSRPARNGSSQFRSFVTQALVLQGYPTALAASLGVVYEAGFVYLKKNWATISAAYRKADAAKTLYDTYKGGKTMIQADKLIRNAAEMGASDKVLTGLSSARFAGLAGVLSGLVSVMQYEADKHKVPLNECALSISKVSLDLAGVISGGLAFETGFGAVLALMSAVSLGDDFWELPKACKLTK
jgi:hypothetical protein